jgi:hypothetical protein
MMRSRTQACSGRSIELFRLVRIRQVEFLPTVEADLVCAVFDREHATQVPVPAAKEKLKNL